MKKRTHFTAVVLQCYKKLDVVNSCSLIEQVYEAYLAGIRQIVVDMSHTDSISEYGLATLWRIVSLLQHRETTDKVHFQHRAMPQTILRSHAVDHTANLQIRNPQPHLVELLMAQGFADVADIQINWYEAIDRQDAGIYQTIRS